MKSLGYVVPALVIAFALLAGTALAAHPPHRVTVDMSDYKFKLSKTTLPRGTAVFQVVNHGEAIHDFKIAGKKTPILVTGKAGVLRVSLLKPGTYKFICTVPGHVAVGMWGVLRVR